LLKIVENSLDDDKAGEVVAIDLAGKTSIAEFMVVTTGASTRQVSAISQHLVARIKAAGFEPPRVEGLANCDWVLVDAGDVIIHVFRPEVREFYNLDRMWLADLATDSSREAVEAQ
jgi:ribosome-associated protein